MSDKNKIAVELVVDDKGTLQVKAFASQSDASFRQVEAAGVGAASRIEAGWKKLKSAWVEILGGMMAVRGAWDLMNSAAKAKQEEVAFASLAASYGASGQQILEQLTAVSRGTIDTLTLVRDVGTAMMMGIKPDETISLMKIAMATTKQTGQTTVKAFSDISLAVGRQSRMILDNLGIIVDVGKANDTYAKALGKTSSQLTDAEKKQAFMNATLAAGSELMSRMGEQVDTNAEKFQRLTATFENIKVATGDVLIRAFNLIEGNLFKLGSATQIPISYFYRLVQIMGGVTDAMHLTSGSFDLWGKKAEEAWATFETMSDKGDQAFKDMMISNDAIIRGQKDYTAAINESAKAQAELEKGRKDIVAQQKKEADEIAKAQEEMYTATGSMADQHYASEAQKLVEKAARWQKAGGDIVTTENWLYDQLGLLEDEAIAKGEASSVASMDRMQGNYRSLVEQLTSQNTLVAEQLTATGMKIQELDGSSFTVTAALDGSGFESSIDVLIGKFRDLAASASIAQSFAIGSAAGSSSGGTSTSWDGGQYDSYQVAADSQTGRDGASLAAKSSSGSKSVTSNTIININQQVSRSDVNAIVSEQKRQEVRK
ncbi:MAG: hypothetical protein PHZ02_07290 [Desulfocapsaceae bacterium]|nr:hypothetical protein [Desulfocapsaceae bacterium]